MEHDFEYFETTIFDTEVVKLLLLGASSVNLFDLFVTRFIVVGWRQYIVTFNGFLAALVDIVIVVVEAMATLDGLVDGLDERLHAHISLECIPVSRYQFLFGLCYIVKV